MNFTCPKCGCNYENDSASCPYCGFVPKKQELPAESHEENKRDGNSLLRDVVAIIVVLCLLGGVPCLVREVIRGSWVGHLVLILLFPFYPLWLI